jgi:hypothetical protein
LVAVADGAGSATFSDEGAFLAVKTGVEALAACLPEQPEGLGDIGMAQLLHEAALRARDAVLGTAELRDISARELASTLLLAVVSPSRVAGLQIGDGAIVTRGPEGDFEALTKPEAGEFINETTFLTSVGAIDTAQVAIRTSPISGVALFSDGLQMLALTMKEGWAPHPRFFGPVFGWLEDENYAETAQKNIEALLSSPRVSARTDDDLTLVVARLL